jgi:hypothetical protein
MNRNLFFAALVGLGLTTWGATESFARPVRPPQVRPVPPQPIRTSGLLVVQVLPGSTAADLGIEPGDIIRGVNGIPVRSITELHTLIRRAGWLAQLDVIDCRTGWPNAIPVQANTGILGVIVRPALGNGTPIPPNPRPRPLR